MAEAKKSLRPFIPAEMRRLVPTLRKHHAGLVFIALASRASAKGWCHPGLDTIAEDAGVDIKTARLAVRLLEQLGIVTIDRKNGKSFGYQINWTDQYAGDEDPSRETVPHPCHEAVGNPTTQGYALLPPDGSSTYLGAVPEGSYEGKERRNVCLEAVWRLLGRSPSEDEKCDDGASDPADLDPADLRNRIAALVPHPLMTDGFTASIESINCESLVIRYGDFDEEFALTISELIAHHKE